MCQWLQIHTKDRQTDEQTNRQMQIHLAIQYYAPLEAEVLVKHKIHCQSKILGDFQEAFIQKKI